MKPGEERAPPFGFLPFICSGVRKKAFAPFQKKSAKKGSQPTGCPGRYSMGGVESAMAPLARAPNHYDISWVCLLLVVVFV